MADKTGISVGNMPYHYNTKETIVTAVSSLEKKYNIKKEEVDKFIMKGKLSQIPQ